MHISHNEFYRKIGLLFLKFVKKILNIMPILLACVKPNLLWTCFFRLDIARMMLKIFRFKKMLKNLPIYKKFILMKIGKFDVKPDIDKSKADGQRYIRYKFVKSGSKNNIQRYTSVLQ